MRYVRYVRWVVSAATSFLCVLSPTLFQSFPTEFAESIGISFETSLVKPAFFLLFAWVQPMAPSFAWAASEIDQQFEQLSGFEGRERLNGLLVVAEKALRADPQKGQVCAEQARELARRLGMAREEALALHWLALYRDAKGNFPEALRFAEAGVQLAEPLPDPKPLIRLLLTKTLVFDHMGSYDQALESSERALRLAGGQDDSALIASAHMSFGLSLFRLNQFEQARGHYQKSRQIAKSLEDLKGESRAINALAYLETMKNPPNHKGALVLFEEALALSRKNGDIKTQSDYLLNMGISYYGIKDYAKSEACYQESLALRTRLGDKLAVAMVQHNISLLMSDTGKKEEGHRLLKEAMQAYREMGARHHLAGALRQEAIYYEEQGDFKEALLRYQAFQKITEELLKADTSQKLANAEARHQTVEKQRQIEILEKDLVVRRARGRVYILGLSALALTALLLYNRYRLKVKTSRVISLANRELETLDAIVKAINGTENLADLLNALLQNAWTLFPQADRLSILLFDPEMDVFRTEAALSKNPDEMGTLQDIALSAGEARLRYSQGQVLAEGIFLIQDVGELLVRRGLREAVCLLVMSIEIEGQRVGYLVLDHLSDAHAFQVSDAIRLSRLRQHAVNALAKARNLVRLQAANDQKDAFLGMAAHDLRHPLNGMVLNAQLAQEDQDPEVLQSRLKHIHQEGLSMSHIIGRFLDIASIEAGKLQAECLPFRLDKMVQRQIQRHLPFAEAKKIKLSAELPSEPVGVLGDERLMLEVLDNLVSNAIKFSPCDRQVCLKVKAGDGKSVVRVEDQGPGLTEADKKRLFGRFAKLSARPTAGEKSTGLGLSIVKHMVETMHGQIWVESEPGSGAVFCVALPSTPITPDLETPSSPFENQGYAFKGLSVLLAEDDPQHRLMARTLLERRGVHVEAVEDGLHVLDFLGRRAFDWVLLDGQMPRMDGPSTVQEIRRRESQGPWVGRHQKVLALTGSFESSEMKMELGYDGYLSKPLDLDALGKMMGLRQMSPSNVDGNHWELLAHAMGGEGIFREFLTVCQDDLEARLRNLTLARREDNRLELCRQAHDLKSSAASLAFMELSDVAKNLELYGHEMSLNDLDQTLKSIENLGLKALDQMQAYLK